MRCLCAWRWVCVGWVGRPGKAAQVGSAQDFASGLLWGLCWPCCSGTSWLSLVEMERNIRTCLWPLHWEDSHREKGSGLSGATTGLCLELAAPQLFLILIFIWLFLQHGLVLGKDRDISWLLPQCLWLRDKLWGSPGKVLHQAHTRNSTGTQ